YERQGRDQNERSEPLCPVLIQDFIDDQFGYRRKHDHHQRAEHCATERPQSHPGIPPQISKNAPDRSHLVLAHIIEQSLPPCIEHSLSRRRSLSGATILSLQFGGCMLKPASYQAAICIPAVYCRSRNHVRLL